MAFNVPSSSCKPYLSSGSFRLSRSMDTGVTQRLVGTGLVVCVAIIWITSSFVVQDLETHKPVSPFVISLLANSLFVLFLPLAYLRRRFFTPNEKSKTTLSDWHIFTSAALVAPFLWAGQCTFNWSLALTSVSSNTILSSTGSIFTFILSLIFLKESFYWYKVISLMMCFAGTVLVSLSDVHGESPNEHPLIGDGIVIVSAMLYACYSIMMSKWLPAGSKPDMLLFFGYMGVVQLLLFSCIGAFFLWFKFITIDLSRYQVLLILAKGFFDNLLSDVLWIRAVLLIGPTIATVGLSLQWPIALIIDAVFSQPTWMSNPLAMLLICLGSALIFVGFVGINFPSDSVNNDKNVYRPVATTEDKLEEIEMLNNV